MLPEQHPDPNWRIATSVRDAHGVRLRIVEPQPRPDAVPADPTLEEAYLALMADEQPAVGGQLVAA